MHYEPFVYIHVCTLNLVYIVMCVCRIRCIYSCMHSESGVYTCVCTSYGMCIYVCTQKSSVHLFVSIQKRCICTHVRTEIGGICIHACIQKPGVDTCMEKVLGVCIWMYELASRYNAVTSNGTDPSGGHLGDGALRADISVTHKVQDPPKSLTSPTFQRERTPPFPFGFNCNSSYSLPCSSPLVLWGGRGGLLLYIKSRLNGLLLWQLPIFGLVRSSDFSISRVKMPQLNSVQDSIYALRKAHICAPPSLSSLPSVAFETVPLIEFDCPEVIFCGGQDVKIHLTNPEVTIYGGQDVKIHRLTLRWPSTVDRTLKSTC